MTPPRGPDDVRAALVAAATELFADRGPRAVSVRRVAEAAGVNHGLVHHYFGSKEGLVVAVLEHLAAEAEAEVRDHARADVVFAAGGATERQGRIVARLLLDGADLADYKSDFPGVRALISRYRGEGMPAAAARERAAQVVALVMGWTLFEPFVTTAAGLEAGAATRRRLLRDGVERLLR